MSQISSRSSLALSLAVAAAMLALVPTGRAAAPARLQLDFTGQQAFAPCPSSVSYSTNCIRLGGSGRSGALGKVSVAVTLVITPVLHKGWKSSITGSVKTARGLLSLTGNNAKAPNGNLQYAIVLKGTGPLAGARGSGALDFYGNLQGNGNFSVDALVQGLL